jgi:hypothetical protein
MPVGTTLIRITAGVRTAEEPAKKLGVRDTRGRLNLSPCLSGILNLSCLV